MKKRYRIGIIIGMYIVSLVSFVSPAWADLQFSYDAVKPENQIGDSQYFNLQMQPGQKQTVQIMLTNRMDQEQTIEVALNSTKTNSNGVLEYGPNTVKNDNSLKHDFKDVVSAPAEITLKPNETVPLNIDISMPETSYDGIIVGGIYLKSKPTKEEEEQKKKESGVLNEYAYVIGMVLKETDAEVKPELALNDVYPGLSNFRNAIFANFSNIEANFVNGMTVEMEVMKKGSDAVLYDTKRADMRMAPNSMIDFPLVMNGDQMEAGDYKAHIKVMSGEQKWEWDKEFKITKEDADKYNSQDVSLIQENGIDWKLIVLIAGLVFVVFLMIFFCIRYFNKKKSKKKKKKRS
ncbi:DUF916 and DUF3324 domain-containing protein [Enterococcus sp. LJL99]